ncbi:MAG: formate--phosphoribosylaminoimidazolecarboxamide ligase [Candidatus Methanomethyliaceae archaeon]|nr:formate--phosphoribosylaminoimidazolecarboxamide ligase [Candidatus Methanomethyliaceae archaeon]MDW7971259.1 formate--phosphoribosylaminoimidazolecarboxamide ligase [Nitrososphaerota archaeon]
MNCIATIGSHSALQILKGAKLEGLKTILICLKKREKFYRSFGLADEIVIVEDFNEILDEEIQGKMLESNAIFIPHGTLISESNLEIFEKKFKPPVFGNRGIFKWEFDRILKDALLKEAGIRIPQHFENIEDVDRPVIVKLPGAEGGRGYFIAKDKHDLKNKLNEMIRRKLLKEDEKIFIQEYIIGVTLYPHFFYSPIFKRLELLGCDRRYETNIDAIGRISAKDQLELDIIPTFRVIGNIPLVIRESMLPEIFEYGERFVNATKKLIPPGMIGPFCLEMVCDENGELYTFEFSGRIVAGTNLFIDGSPYSNLLFDEPMSMGRRIAREIKIAEKEGRIEEVIT